MKIIFLLITIIILLCIYLIYETFTLQLTKYEITTPKIPSNFNNYKIIQISDFHNTKSSKLNTALINTLKKEQPNLIFITGDLVGSSKNNMSSALTFLNNIADVAPIYYVTGNHEAKINNYSELKKHLLTLKVNILDNQITTININNQSLTILGVADPNFTPQTYSAGAAQTISTELTNLISPNDNNYKILLSHRPELFETYVNKKIDLIFTGHAHGGQIRIPFIGALHAPNQGFFPKYTSGIFKNNNSTMIVSRGIGTSTIPFRINCRPELVITTLKKS